MARIRMVANLLEQVLLQTFQVEKYLDVFGGYHGLRIRSRSIKSSHRTIFQIQIALSLSLNQTVRTMDTPRANNRQNFVTKQVNSLESEGLQVNPLIGSLVKCVQ